MSLKIFKNPEEFTKHILSCEGKIVVDGNGIVKEIKVSGTVPIGKISGAATFDSQGKIDSIKFGVGRSLKIAEVGAEVTLAEDKFIGELSAKVSADIGALEAEVYIKGSINWVNDETYLTVVGGTKATFDIGSKEIVVYEGKYEARVDLDDPLGIGDAGDAEDESPALPSDSSTNDTSTTSDGDTGSEQDTQSGSESTSQDSGAGNNSTDTETGQNAQSGSGGSADSDNQNSDPETDSGGTDTSSGADSGNGSTDPVQPGGKVTIKKGDTLSELAEKFGVSVEGLREKNGIKDADRIFVGEELEVPTKEEDAQIRERLAKEREEAKKAAEAEQQAGGEGTNTDTSSEADTSGSEDAENNSSDAEDDKEEGDSGKDENENEEQGAAEEDDKNGDESSEDESGNETGVDNVVAGTIGSVVGSHLGMALGVDGRFEAAAVNTVGMTFGRNIGEVIGGNADAFDDFFKGSGHADNTTGVEDFASSDLGQNIVGAGIGLASSFLTSELSNLLDIGGDFGGALFETVADFAISSVIEQGFINAGFNPVLEGGGTLFDGIDALTSVDALSSLGGGFLGGFLARQVIDIDTQAEAIGSSLGSALGTWGGVAAATSIVEMASIGQTIIPVPFVGAVIGAFVGTILGGLFGGLFGGSKPKPPPPPHAEATMVLNEDGEFELDRVEMRHGGDGGGVGETVSSMANNLNAIIAATGGAIANPEVFSSLTLGYTKNTKYLNGKQVGSLSEGVDKGVLQTIRSLEIEGGDAVIKRAIYNSDATTVQELVEDVQAAEHYRTYLEHQEEVDQLLAAEESIEKLIEKAEELEAGTADASAQEAAVADGETADAAEEELTPEELRAKAEELSKQTTFWKNVLQQADDMHLDEEHASDSYSKLGKLLEAGGVDFSGHAITDLVIELSHGELTIAAKGAGQEGVPFADLQPRFTITDWDDWKQDASTLTLADGTIVSLGGLVESFGISENSGPVDLGEAMAERLGTDGIAGTDMNDVLVGTSGDDTMAGGKGRDVLKGGAGRDTADYSSSAEGVEISLLTGKGKGGDAQGDTLVDIENVIGTDKRDVLKGDNNANVFHAGAGDDAVVAGAGDDTVLGGAGEDVINAGSGDDVVDGGADSDTIFGDDGNDRAAGGAANDSIFAGSGDDLLSGGSGNDMLTGGSGDDVILGGSGDDVLVGGEGNDYMVGGDGIDTAIFDGDAGDYTIKTVNGRTTVTRKDGTGDEDVLSGVEFFQFDDSTVSVLDTIVASGGDSSDEEDEEDNPRARVLPSGASMIATAAALGIAAVLVTEESSAADQFYDLNPDETVIPAGTDEVVEDAPVTVAATNEQPADAGAAPAAGDNTVTHAAGSGSAGTADDTVAEGATESGTTASMPELHIETATSEGSGITELPAADTPATETGTTGSGASSNESGEESHISIPDSELRMEYSPRATGFEDTSILLELNAHFTSPEKAVIIISGVPDGVALSAGISNGAGVWTLNYGQLTGLRLLMPDDWSADFELGLSVTAFNDIDPHGSAFSFSKTKTSTFTVEVQATTHTPTLAVTDVTAAVSATTAGQVMNGSGIADTVYAGGGNDTVYGDAGDDVLYGDSAVGLATSPLDIVSTMVLPDADNSETLTLAVFGVPVGGYLSAGAETPVGSGIWSLTAAELAGLEITVPAGADDYTIAVVATTTDIDPDTGPVSKSTAPVEILIKASDVSGDDVLHGGAGADVLHGEEGADVLWGNAGADSLYGGAGDDVLHVDAEDIVYDGGEGNDTIIADGATGITVDIGANNVERAFGGAHADNLYTSTTAGVYLDGGAGADALTGNAGDDILIGGAGNDTFHAGGGDDTLYVDSDDTIIDAGSGTDTLIATGNSGVDIDLSAASVEIATGTDHADTFRISGVDAVVADLGGGDDVVFSGGGADTLTGGTGNDTVSYELSGTGVSASLVAGVVGMGGHADGDVLTGFENITGSGHDDVLTGDDLINQLVGNAGNDVLNGGGGDDILTGGTGDDVLNGGAGTDTAVFAGNFADYNVTKTGLNAGTVTWTGAAGANSGTDTVTGIETLQFADATIYLDGRNNRPYTQADTATTREDTTVVIAKEDVFANDLEFDGDAMHISSVSAAVNGTVSITAGGDIQFRPDSNFFGEASFTYTASDAHGLEHSSTVTVTVDAVNDAPTLKAGGAQYSGNHSPYRGSGRVLGTDVDDADSSLTYQLISGSGFSVSADGSFSYNGGSRTASMVVRITDPHGESSDHTINITNPKKPSGGGKKPLAMDLDNDGLEFIGIDDSDVYMDVNNDAFLEHLAWVSGDDGLLAFDRNNDGQIEGFDEISFANDHADARTDLEGLALGYDSNKDGVFNAQDEMWDRFGVWQDVNENGVCEEGEFTGLEAFGMVAIGLASDWQAERIGDTVLFGNTSFETTNGHVGIMGDVAFLYDDSRYLRVDNDDGSSRIVQVSEGTAEGKQELDAAVDEVLSELQEQQAASGADTEPVEAVESYVPPEESWVQGQVEESASETAPEATFETASGSGSDAGVEDSVTWAGEGCEVAEAMAVFDAPDAAQPDALPQADYQNTDSYFDDTPDMETGL